jgi:hypothetical protein
MSPRRGPRFPEWSELPDSQHPETNGPASHQQGYRRLQPRRDRRRYAPRLRQLSLPFDDTEDGPDLSTGETPVVRT